MNVASACRITPFSFAWPSPKTWRSVANVVEQHPGRLEWKPGYTLEVFNAIGESVDVVTVRESQIDPLTADELLTLRPLAAV